LTYATRRITISITNKKRKENVMTAVRLPIELEQKLDAYSKVQNTSKSEIIKEALEEYFCHESSGIDSYTSGLAYFGQFGSEDGNLSVNYKKILKEKIHAKQHTH